MQNPINQYLEDPFMYDDVDVSDITPRSISFTDEDVAKINRIGLADPNIKYVEPKQPKRLRRGQIWTVKKSYIDGYGNEVTTPFLFIVMITGIPPHYRGVKFLNVVTITPHVEMSTGEKEDVLVLDKSLLGFEFMIETWNQHSMRADILDKYQGTYNRDKHGHEYSCEYTCYFPDSDIKKFRSLEIRNAGYLTHSIWSYIPE